MGGFQTFTSWPIADTVWAMRRSAGIVLGLFLLSASSAPAANLVKTSPERLCGIDYRGRADLMLRLRSGGAKVFEPSRSRITTVWVRSANTLWWFTRPGAPAFPAVACSEAVAGLNGYDHRLSEADCGSAHTRACQALKAEIAKAKF
jgi:hypothetical protein